jgi:hypothetical protein
LVEEPKTESGVGGSFSGGGDVFFVSGGREKEMFLPKKRTLDESFFGFGNSDAFSGGGKLVVASVYVCWGINEGNGGVEESFLSEKFGEVFYFEGEKIGLVFLDFETVEDGGVLALPMVRDCDGREVALLGLGDEGGEVSDEDEQQ